MTKLYRSRRDSKLTGLCGGLAELLNVDSTILRLVVVITTFFSGGTVIPIYIIASLVIPKEPGFNTPPVYPPGGGQGFYGNTYGGPYQGGAYQSGPARPQDPYHTGPAHAARPSASQQAQPASSSIDEMMKDVEKKAMWKEIEELRAKVAKYEKGE
ncbi:MAG: hypothetical protein K0Q90_3232 [Paenibacillaceae bacterium]|jgi:phage shock protein PspC (stress-responsive transcriptional regulator)|nr:hypothetical protein [Paenibacillaceae bacterium]